MSNIWNVMFAKKVIQEKSSVPRHNNISIALISNSMLAKTQSGGTLNYNQTSLVLDNGYDQIEIPFSQFCEIFRISTSWHKKREREQGDWASHAGVMSMSNGSKRCLIYENIRQTIVIFEVVDLANQFAPTQISYVDQSKLQELLSQ